MPTLALTDHALFTEMYGFPLTIYLLSGWLTTQFPGVDWFAHDSGHLLEILFGWRGNPHFGPFHLLSSLFIGGGFWLLAAAWPVLYRAQQAGTLATTGPYGRVRHPQHVGFVLIMFGFLLQWPTLLTLAMFPVLVFMYISLARREVAAEVGECGLGRCLCGGCGAGKVPRHRCVWGKEPVLGMRFLRSFFANPVQMGAAFPSSPALAERITDPIDFARARVIVELGPGTGAFTRVLAQRAHPDCRVLALELDPRLAAFVAARYPRVEVVNAPAQTLGEVLAARGLGQVDAVVCGLPFANFSACQQATVVNAVHAALRSGGAFVSYSFVHAQLLPTSRRFRRNLEQLFGCMDIYPVLFNAPPALVYSCVA